MVLDQLFRDQANSETKFEVAGMEEGSLEGLDLDVLCNK
jgi:hypothetical protein